jgi:general secretion pathway protein A
MYKGYYNLKRNPFEITPDPTFLFATKKHNEGLAALYYGVRRRKGFVVMTGEVGTGKTLLVRCLLQILNQTDVSYAYVFNPRLSPLEFLQYIAGDFRLPAASKSKSELLLSLSQYLIARHEKGFTTVLVVDEAHHLSADVLEEIRLLTNLETSDEKLLQILLVGQPELNDTLDSVELRQLKQRIALRSHLGALDLDLTRDYVHYRLKRAGSANPVQLFPMETILKVYRHSQGLPRLINTLCENGLIHGYARQTPTIAPEVIDEVATGFRLNQERPSSFDRGVQGSTLMDVEQAARALLDLSAHLRRLKDSDEELKMSFSGGVRKHEPYI